MQKDKLVQKPSSKIFTDLSLFIKEIASNPSAMGAACPSSKYLGQCIASEVPNDPGLIVELGAGTGVITEALLAQGIPADQLLVIELSEPLAKHLRKRFSHLNVICGDARALEVLLGNRAPSIIVSSLPLRSLPRNVVKDIGHQIEKVLPTNGLYIQFTYSLHRKPKPPSAHLQWFRSKYIWRNLPPARVDLFRLK